MPTGNVYVVQQRYSRLPGGEQKFHEYGSAAAFGNIIYLVPPKAVVDDLYGGDVEKLLNDRLKTFSNDDFLILTGDPILCAQSIIVAISMLDEHIKTLKVLKWDFQNESYIPVEIPLPF